MDVWHNLGTSMQKKDSFILEHFLENDLRRDNYAGVKKIQLVQKFYSNYFLFLLGFLSSISRIKWIIRLSLFMVRSSSSMWMATFFMTAQFTILRNQTILLIALHMLLLLISKIHVLNEEFNWFRFI